MKNKYKFKKIIWIWVLPLTLILGSCEEYLDKSEEADVTIDDVFGTFEGFQGFVEQLYFAVPDWVRHVWVCDWNMADEVVGTPGNTEWRVCSQFDLGNYWYWTSTWQCYLNNGKLDPSDGGDEWSDAFDQNKPGYTFSWYGIRKANIGLANIESFNGTQEERNILEGQLYFFRGFFHFQLMKYFGGLPYIDEVLGKEAVQLSRLSYQETAELAAADFAKAAELLPLDWDKTSTGKRTLNNNNQRITKSTALGYLGKNLLYAASPLMNRESKGIATFDAELCKRAADAFMECLELSHSGKAPYQLIEMDRYLENFHTVDGILPGAPETMMYGHPYGGPNGAAGYAIILNSLYLPPSLGGDGNQVSLCANYVNNFGMENGLPIDDPESGFNPDDPWSNRDPRFYETVIYDGVQVVEGGDASVDDIRYANLYTDGNYRGEVGKNFTGYMLKKFINMTLNKVDAVTTGKVAAGYMRLADVYLMYAEAVLQGYGSATSSAPAVNGFTLTAEEALNIVRDRAGAGHVAAKFTANKEAFMEEIIRERAIELMCEQNIRFCDIRRWLVADQMEYREKTAIYFDRNETSGLPINMREEVYTTRVFENKHYWLPLPTDQVSQYPEFYQNPGW